MKKYQNFLLFSSIFWEIWVDASRTAGQIIVTIVAEKKKPRYSSAAAKYLTWKQKSKTNQKKKEGNLLNAIFLSFGDGLLFAAMASAEVAPVISRGPVQSADLQFALCHQTVCSRPMRVIDIRGKGIVNKMDAIPCQICTFFSCKLNAK